MTNMQQDRIVTEISRMHQHYADGQYISWFQPFDQMSLAPHMMEDKNTIGHLLATLNGYKRLASETAFSENGKVLALLHQNHCQNVWGRLAQLGQSPPATDVDDECESSDHELEAEEVARDDETALKTRCIDTALAEAMDDVLAPADPYALRCFSEQRLMSWLETVSSASYFIKQERNDRPT
jgi:hypothetical protein